MPYHDGLYVPPPEPTPRISWPQWAMIAFAGLVFGGFGIPFLLWLVVVIGATVQWLVTGQ